MKIRIQTRYASDDPKCNGDYCAVEVFVDGKLVKHWGDDYHDKGADKSEGFVEGIVWSQHPKKVEITRIQVADYEC